MNEGREALEFLARSENRMGTLFELRTGSQSRDELREATGMSQVTIGRVLTDLEERGWIDTAGDEYQLTAVGGLVTDALEDFLDAIAAAEALSDLAPWLPTDTYEFGLERLADATLVRPEPTDPIVTMRTAARQVAGSDHVRILTQAFSALVVDVMYERVLADELTVECVFSTPVFEAMGATTDVADELAALVEAEGATFHRYDGDIPHIFAVLDDSVGIGVADDEGLPRATLEVVDPVVREWAIETFERYRDGATPVDDPDGLETEGSSGG